MVHCGSDNMYVGLKDITTASNLDIECCVELHYESECGLEYVLEVVVCTEVHEFSRILMHRPEKPVKTQLTKLSTDVQVTRRKSIDDVSNRIAKMCQGHEHGE